MIVFLSWSGPLSRAVAELLASWLPEVIQEVKPWVSSQNIEKGSIWSGEIDKAMATTVGVLCVTQSNKNAPWLLFEAGGLYKGLEEVRVCPLLIDLESKDVEQPLSRFQFTMPNKEDMGKLLTTINAVDPEKALPKERLQSSFDRMWPEFEKSFRELLAGQAKEAKPAGRTMEDMMDEVLEITRALQRNSERVPRGGQETAHIPPQQTERTYTRTLLSEMVERYDEERAKRERAEKERAKKERAKENSF